ncbi:MAG: YihY/virulence factor BrkB family protein [Saprospiraceae bacterium]|nr:YihY/virulence factor BrkB family protein [Saprospiraceae bacterium]
MSYHFFLALFPAIVFLFTLTAYLPKEFDLFLTLEVSMRNILPEDTSRYLWDNVISGLKPQAKGSLLSLGFILALYFASDGILAMMKGFDKTYKSSFRKRSFLEKQIVALSITILLGLLLIVSVILLILGGTIFSWFLEY